MEPMITLYERESAPLETLLPTLATYYDGGLMVHEGTEEDRPYVIANFVETLDGIVSYNTPSQTGGGLISGNKEQDRMVMGLLRARADAVIFGSNSLRLDANHLRIASYIYPKLAKEYDAWRIQLGRQEHLPMSVIMTASGQIDLNDRTFHTPGLKALIVTTTEGYDTLATQTLPPGTEIRVIEPLAKGLSPKAVLALLAREYKVCVALYEGGPTLLASFLAEHLIDELFLTLSPRIAGQSSELHRLTLLEGHAFPPKTAPWATLLSVKLAGSHLLLRYRFSQNG